MITDQRKQAVEVNRRTHLEMDEIDELLELARKTDSRSWCILTLAFNHGLRVSECAGGAPAILRKNRPAIPPLMLSDIDMRHRTIRVRRLKGSLETTQAFIEHRGKPALSDYACLKAYLAVRIDDESGFPGGSAYWNENTQHAPSENRSTTSADGRVATEAGLAERKK